MQLLNDNVNFIVTIAILGIGLVCAFYLPKQLKSKKEQIAIAMEVANVVQTVSNMLKYEDKLHKDITDKVLTATRVSLAFLEDLAEGEQLEQHTYNSVLEALKLVGIEVNEATDTLIKQAISAVLSENKPSE